MLKKKYHDYICDRSWPSVSTDYIAQLVAEKNGGQSGVYAATRFHLQIEECGRGAQLQSESTLLL